MNRRARATLWFDACAAGSAGLTVLMLHDWLGQLYAFAPRLVLFVGVANLSYASYSGSLAALASHGRWPSRRAIDLLVAANLSWVAVCAALFASTFESASVFGMAHLALEGLFVGSLALLERRWVRPFAR